MGFEFSGKRAIVTGASSGIGAGIARRFAGLGVKVVITARREERLEEVAEEIRSASGTALVVPGDVTVTDSVSAVVEQTVAEFGSIDIMVNCAGLGGPKLFEETPPERFRQHMEVNYFGMVEYCRQVIPLMKEQGSGYIVNVASVSALMGFPTYVSYSASKAAILRFSDSLRHEVNKHGITISVFCPSLVNTALVYDHWEDHADWVTRFKFLDVEAAVKYLIKGMRKEKFIILDILDVRAMYFLYRLFPRVFTNLFMWLYKIRT